MMREKKRFDEVGEGRNGGRKQKGEKLGRQVRKGTG